MSKYAGSHTVKRKRRIHGVALVLASALVSKTAWSSGASTPGTSRSDHAATTPAAVVSSDVSPSTADFQELKELLQAQSDQLRKLTKTVEDQQEEIRALKDGRTQGSSAAAVVATLPQVDGAIGAIGPITHASVTSQSSPQQAGPDLVKRIDSLEARLKNFGPFSFSGDFRLRDEPYFGGPINNSQVRNRERFRARVYLNAKLNDDLGGGLSLASGDPNDPITSNQTANQFFTRKPFLLERAFVTYNPHQFKALTLTGGKFAFPWYRTQLTWDDDINPEGVAQRLEWQSTKWHYLRQIALVGFELPFAETQNTEAIKTFTQPINATFPYADASVHQSVVYGGQLQTRWQLGSWLTITADSAFYNWHNADPVALANQVAYGNATASSPGVGIYTLNGTLTNSFQTITETVSAAPTSGATPVVVSRQIIAAKLNSKFAITDNILQFDIKTPSARWPVRFLADYAQNTRACANATPLTTTATPVAGGVIGAPATTNGACRANERRANWLEARFGRQSQKGDFQFAYTHMLIEREAVISVFNFSDIRQGSNVAQNRVEAFYQVHPNVQLGATGYFGRSMGTTDATETLLKRFQFDVIYKF